MITVVHDQALCCLVASVAGWQLVVLMKFQLELHGDLGICSHWIVIWISRIGSCQATKEVSHTALQCCGGQ
jgi:hypothetical protein